MVRKQIFGLSTVLLLLLCSILVQRGSPAPLGCEHDENAGACVGCMVVVDLIQLMVRSGKSDAYIAKAVETICIDFRAQTKRSCVGFVKVFSDQMMHILRKLPNARGDKLCNEFLGPGCGKPGSEPSWNIRMPNKAKPPVAHVQPPKPGSQTLKVLQLSDIHLDFHYQPGSKAGCGEAVCCRDGTPATGEPPAGYWGDYRDCDSPPWLVDNLFEHLSKNHQFDYIIHTGDLPPHDDWDQKRWEHVKYYSNLTAKFQKYFPRTRVYSTMGNHETVPVNFFSQPYVKGEFSMSWLYDAVANNWTKTGVPTSEENNIKYGSYFTTQIRPGLRIISVNMNYCNSMNMWLLLDNKDPAEQLQWMVDELQKAEDNGEKVHIIGHIPPGDSDCLRQWSWNYYKIIHRYESTIRAQFFGHKHKDLFQLFYDEATFKRPTSMAYLSPSVTTYSYLNPGYRVYSIDGEHRNTTWAVLDAETYVMNLTDANLNGKQPDWRFEYSAREAYGLKQLQPVDWDDLVSRMEGNATLFNEYWTYKYKQNPRKRCDDKCRKLELCDLVTGRSRDPQLCKKRFGVDQMDMLLHAFEDRLC